MPLLACLVAFACDSPVAPNPLAEHQILFVNSEEGAQGQDIYRMNPDGTGRENLTKLSSVPYSIFVLAITYRSLALSPDGRTVAFREYSRDAQVSGE